MVSCCCRLSHVVLHSHWNHQRSVFLRFHNALHLDIYPHNHPFADQTNDFILSGLRIMNKYLFGRYLLEKGLITMTDVIDARLLQRKNNRMIGDLAMTKGMLAHEDILRILVIQEETKEKFGEIAIKEKYLSKEQVDDLLKEQMDSHIFFGEALVQIEAISQEELAKQLKKFDLIKKQQNTDSG